MIVCRECKERLPEEMFAFKNKAQGKRSTICKPCHQDYIKTWRTGNPTSERRATRELKARKKKYIQELKSQPCMDCGGVFHFAAMDFDHRPGTQKLFNPCEGVERGWDQLKAEIAKCDLVCANCHRVRTYMRIDTG